jgi:hypothetical protein
MDKELIKMFPVVRTSKHRRNPANFYKCVAKRRKRNRIASKSRRRNFM